MDTRFGTLNFFGGFPDKESADKLYDNLDFQRAVQAYLLALPVVNQASNRDNILTLGPANKTVPIWETMVDSRTVELTANDNTPYTWFWIDLRDGPIVVEAPPKVLGLADDMWYRWVGDIGLTGPDKGKGGKYLFLPPGYKGDVPSGYFVMRPGSYSVLPVGAVSSSMATPNLASISSRRRRRSIASPRPKIHRRSLLSICPASHSIWLARPTIDSGSF